MLTPLLAPRHGTPKIVADDDLKVVPSSEFRVLSQVSFTRNFAAIEHPLAQPSNQHRVRQLSDGAIEPEMHAGDRSRFQLIEPVEWRFVEPVDVQSQQSSE